MSLFDSASLVVTPNGYKEDKLYSIKPTDGSGDLVVTRATTATRVNSAGLVEIVPYNLVQYSEQFDNTAMWNLSNVSIVANNTTAPNGTLTADKATCASGSSISPNIYSNNFSVVNGTQYTWSFYAKKGSNKYVKIRFSGSGFSTSTVIPVFDLDAGTVVSGTGTITNIGDGWYRCSAIEIANASGDGIVTIDLPSSTNVWPNGNFNGTEFIFLWGAQLNQGTLKEYFPTTDRLNVPRIDYTNGSCPSILVEPQRTNLLTYSEQFDNAAWVKTQLTVTANATTSPSGLQNADKIIPSNVNSFHNLYNFASTLTGSYVFNVFAKKGGYNFLNLQDQFGGVFNSCFDLNNGTFTTYAGSASIKSFGNDWYLCTVIGSGSGVTVIPSIIPSNSNSSFPIFVGNGTDGVFIWGAQLEAGSYATSYIPTVASAVTRNADVISKTGISSLIGQTEGTMFFDIYRPTLNAPFFYIIANSVGTNNYLNSIFIFQNANGNIRTECLVSGVQQAVISTSGLSVGRHKIAVAYKQNDFALYIDGSLIGTDTSGNIPPLSAFEINGTDAGSIGNMNINTSALWKTRLTNTELASLTTI